MTVDLDTRTGERTMSGAIEAKRAMRRRRVRAYTAIAAAWSLDDRSPRCA